MYVRQYFLEANGIPLSQIIYVNFEDERLLEMTAEDLNLILEIGLEISETDIKPYLFLDEIQNINGWEKFVRRIAESVTKPLSYNRLTNILKSSGMSIGKQTVINYVSYMTDSYLLFTLQNYAAKLVEKETSLR